MNSEIRKLLESVRSGETSVDDAMLELKKAPFEDIGYAKVDLHRKVRQGAAEVIYGAGKTPEQIGGIIDAMRANGQTRVLITRMSPEAAAYVGSTRELDYHQDARVGIVGGLPQPDGIGKVVIATGGTSDIPVAEEAALTAQVLGSEVVRCTTWGFPASTGCLPIWILLWKPAWSSPSRAWRGRLPAWWAVSRNAR